LEGFIEISGYPEEDPGSDKMKNCLQPGENLASYPAKIRRTSQLQDLNKISEHSDSVPDLNVMGNWMKSWKYLALNPARIGVTSPLQD
jgi:hypothetical protein